MSIRDLFNQRDHTQDEGWRKEDHWYNKEFQAQENTNYDKVLDFAKSKYDELKKVHDDLDKKAEWCFALAIATTGGLIVYHDKLELSLDWCFPSMFFLLGAMWFALRVKLPGPRSAPFTIRGAIERAQNTMQLEAWLCASLHCAAVGMEFVNARKAQKLRVAGTLIVCGIAILCVVACLNRIPWPIENSETHLSYRLTIWIGFA